MSLPSSPRLQPRHRLRALSPLLALLGFLSCDIGEGSLVAPFLPGGPKAYVATAVVNQDNLPIVGALASAEGSSSLAAASRSGRFYLSNPPIGQGRLTVDPQNGTATNGDEYATLVYRPGIPAGKATLRRAVVLPDLTKGASALLILGTLASPIQLDASSSAGAQLDLAAGTILSQGANSGAVKVSLVRVDKDQLPLDLPRAASGVLLAGRGIWLTPLDLGLSGGSRTLIVTNDLGLSAGAKADLLRLDPVSGQWNPVGTGTVQAGGTDIQSDGGALPGGGIYVYTTSVSVSTAVSGKVVDESQNPIVGAHVIVGESGVVFTNAQGDFLAPSVAQQDAGGSAVMLPIFVLPPLGYAPAIKRVSFNALPNSTNVGTIQTGAYPVTHLQSQAVIRGRGLGNARIFQGGGGLSPSVIQAQGAGEFSTATVTQ